MSWWQQYLINNAVMALTMPIRMWPESRLNDFLVRFGFAFGPPGLRHFSQLSLEEQADLLERVPVLKKNHDDWWKPFQWVPRRLTVWIGPPPKRDDILWGIVAPGERSEVPPVPKPGESYVIRGYLAETTIEGLHTRLGWRYDDVDGYWEASFSMKIVK